MKLFPLWLILFTGIFKTCHPTSHFTSLSLLGLTSSIQQATQEDSIRQVAYTVRSLRTDTTLFKKARQVSSLTDKTLAEASGLAPSYTNPGQFWTQEDSGNDNQIQLLQQDGSVLARYILDGVINRDWEDIATGPGPTPGKTYVYLAEIGDNDRKYSEKIIYRFPEPSLPKQKGPFTDHIKSIDSIRLKLTNGPQNAEAILLDPIRKELLLLTKGTSSIVYQVSFSQATNKVQRISPVLRLPFDQVTAGSISSTGSEILIRTYNRIFYYTRRPNESILDALQRPPVLIPIQLEPQGEAICWSVDESGFYTTSEKLLFYTQQLYFYQRKPKH